MRSSANTNGQIGSGVQRQIVPKPRLFSDLRSTWATWLVPLPKNLTAAELEEQVIAALRSIAENHLTILGENQGTLMYARFSDKHPGVDKSGNRVVRIDVLSPRSKALSLLKITIDKELENGNLICQVECMSSGPLPCTVPLSPVLNSLLWWVPYPDIGSRTVKQLETMKQLLEAELAITINQVIFRTN